MVLFFFSSQKKTKEKKDREGNRKACRDSGNVDPDVMQSISGVNFIFWPSEF